MGNPDLIGTVEAADILGVSRSTLLNWSRPPRITGIKLPGETGPFVFDRADVLKLKSELEAESENAQAVNG